METLPIKISDTTLRDGEQQAGLFFPHKMKQEFAHLISQTGVSEIEIMPCVCDDETKLVKTLVAEGLKHQIVAATPIKKDFIDIAKDCDLGQIVLFKGLSDRLLFLRDHEISQMKEFQGKTIDDDIPDHIINRIRQNAIDEIVNHLRYATQEAGLRVKFAIEDASRADFDFLVECLRTFSPSLAKHYRGQSRSTLP